MLLLLALAALALAQEASDRWLRLDTEHFQVYYPDAAREWAEQAASELEVVHAGVESAVGWEVDRAVEVVVMDPWAMANGMALPLRRNPAIVLWATPPESSSSIGSFRSWSEGLMTHEDTHIVHMLRPSRDPALAILYDFGIGVGPIALKSPIWMVEGYAVHLEGALTGSGRPHGEDRAALLRQWALAGHLPAYEGLEFSDGWQGRAVPYMVGSAFVDWLAEGWGEDALRALWTRLAAVDDPEFDDAFAQVFGDAPAVIYGRFVAQTTAYAMDVLRARPRIEGVLWDRFPHGVGAPSLSPDGKRLAMVVEGAHGTERLEIRSAQPNVSARTDWAIAEVERLEADPEDVLAAVPEVFSLERLAVRHATTRGAVEPRWLPDGSALIFASWVRHGDGVGPDLWRWSPEGGERRLTRGARVRSPDPHPTEGWAVAVHQSWGQTSLVRVDLADGAVSPLLPARSGVQVDSPRISPDGARLLWLENRDGWRLMEGAIDGSGAHEIEDLAGTPRTPTWDPGGRAIWVAAGRRGFQEIERIDLDTHFVRRWTQSEGAAWAPTLGPDGSLYYLVTAAIGVELRRADSAAPPYIHSLRVDAQPPVVSERPVEVPPITPIPIPEARRYGLGDVRARWVVGGLASPSGSATELGLSWSDAIGRSRLIGMASFWSAGDGVSGGALAWKYRGLPVAVEARGYSLEGGYGTCEGASLDLSHPLRGARARGLLSAGAWIAGGRPDESEGGMSAEGWGSLEGRTARAHDDFSGVLEGALRGAKGPYSWGSGELALSGHYRNWGLRLETRVLRGERIEWVGYRSSLAPESWSWNQVWSPAAPGLIAKGAGIASIAISPLGEGLDLYAEHHRLWEPHAFGHTRYGDDLGLAGLRAHGTLANLPILRAPELSLEAGIATVYVHPETGWAPLGESWRSWVSLAWRP